MEKQFTFSTPVCSTSPQRYFGELLVTYSIKNGDLKSIKIIRCKYRETDVTTLAEYLESTDKLIAMATNNYVNLYRQSVG
jgi:hypothetical protein